MGKKKYCTPAILLLQGGADPGTGGGSHDPNWPDAKGVDYEPEWEENEERPLWE